MKHVILSLAFALALLPLTSSPALAQQPATPDAWTPEVSMQYHGVSDVALAPNSDRVAFVVREPLMEGEQSEYRSHIHLVQPGADPVQFTRGEHSATSPAFSPDGRYLAFLTSRSDGRQIWLMRTDGGEAWQLTHVETGVSSFQWSPDGSRIAYTMQDPPTEEEEQRERERRDVEIVGENLRYSHLYTIRVGEEVDSTAVQRLTGGEMHVTGFDWSPDGETIVFAHRPDPRINPARLHGAISIVPSDSGAVEPLVEQPGPDRSPRYSPDGQYVAFVSDGGQPEPVGLGDVYVVPAEGGEPRKLADTPDRSASIEGWTEDGSAVLISEWVRTSRHVLALPIDGSEPEQITTGEGVYGNIAFDRDAGRLAFTYQDVDTPADVYLASADNFERQQLTDLHADVPRPEMGRTELLTWTAPDGLEIEGLLTYPVGYEEGEQVPLILSVHGGPAGIYSRTFTGNPGIYMIQYFAEQGYAVLRPNPRGSTGYGKDFRFANVQDWGYGDYEDLMAGVDTVIDMGVAHPDSLALMGWSYGGYMTSFAVTRTDRFQAASMGAGLPNLISMVTTTDIPDYLTAHLGGEFWEDYETYQRHSAIYRIENVTTPTQVIHGAEDLRVPFTQGQEFYVALKRLGVPTEMVVYPRTPHGPREPKLLMDVSDRVLSWFERHVRGREVAPYEPPVANGNGQ